MLNKQVALPVPKAVALPARLTMEKSKATEKLKAMEKLTAAIVCGALGSFVVLARCPKKLFTHKNCKKKFWTNNVSGRNPQVPCVEQALQLDLWFRNKHQGLKGIHSQQDIVWEHRYISQKK